VADDEHRWFHFIPAPGSKFSVETHFRSLQQQCAALGLKIPGDDPRCFRLVTTRDGERSLGKYHCAFDVDWDRVPVDPYHRTFDLRKFKNFSIAENPEYPDEGRQEGARIWFAPDNLKRIFGVCHICLQVPRQGGGPCIGHAPKSDKRALTGDARRENGKRRVADRATKQAAAAGSIAF
jgi:hypothetical protein